LATVRVVRHVQGNLKKRGEPKRSPASENAFPLIAIASSLGGPKALSSLLKSLPRTLPAAIVICQHISDGFTAGLASWLAAESKLPVVEAMEGQALQPGMAFVARSSFHLRVRKDATLQLEDTAPVMGFRPSCDLLLTSAAETFGSRCIGVILTGMGRDGARGLLEIRRRGGHTIAQDEATCVVYGMPREAMLLGGVQEQLPLDQIGPALVKRVGP
jgi:two-component system chemotaxis response regulator CheB